MIKFSQFIIEKDAYSFIKLVKEENLLGILTALKKKITELLNESIDNDIGTSLRYLKIVAMFEQLFRFFVSKKVDPSEVLGLKTLIDKRNIDQISEAELTKGIETIFHAYDDHHMIDFKRIVERRYSDFKKWFNNKDKEDLEIVKGAIEFTLSSIHKYNLEIS
jgi:hypothetical protein